MNSKYKCAVSLAIAGLVGTFVGSAKAVIMDQIGTSPSFITSGNAFTSDVFEAANAAYDVGVVDDLTVSGPTVLTKVFAAVEGFGSSFVSFSDVTSWRVEVYSSLANANSSLIGDVYNHVYAPSAVTLTTPFGGSATSALFNVSALAVLPSAGTYYLAVIADNSLATNGEIGVYGSSGAANSTPGGLNAYQVNPGGGFGFGGNPNPVNLDAAYAVEGVAVPEPTTAALAGAAVGIVSLARRRRRV